MEYVMANEAYLKLLRAQFDLLTAEEQAKPENLYLYQPARAEYDARFGGMREQKAIAALFRAARDRLYPAVTDGYYMMALADTLEKMNIQIYEHYRVLADLLLEAARVCLPEPGVMAQYALMKGVRMGVLDPEKYLPAARRAFERTARTAENADFYRLAQDEYGRCGQ